MLRLFSIESCLSNLLYEKVLWPFIQFINALQAGLDDSVKDMFYEDLQWTLTKISASEILFHLIKIKKP